MFQLYLVPKVGHVTQFWPFLAWGILGNVFLFDKREVWEERFFGVFFLCVCFYFPATPSSSL